MTSTETPSRGFKLPFLPVSTCCLNPLLLPGEPRGTLIPSSNNEGRHISMYTTLPKDGNVVDGKAAVVLLYDMFGFGVDNPKILADQFADQTGLKVFVPDYIREFQISVAEDVPVDSNPPPVEALSPLTPTFPNENKDKSVLKSVKDWSYAISAMLSRYRLILPGPSVKMCRMALEQIHQEGYERLGLVGYCRGGGMSIHLLSSPPPYVKCASINHPSAESHSLYNTFNVPTLWNLAEDDVFFGSKEQAKVREILGKKEGLEANFEVYPETVHGFAARPNLTHEPTKMAFEKANNATAEFLKRHLILDGTLRAEG